MTTVADVFIDTLENAGIKRIYGIVGDSLNGLTNALQKRKTIEWIHTRHEEVAAFAAGAEAQLTGELTVCAGSCGPGNTHLINGLYDCQRSYAPVLAIAAHIPTPEIGGDYFQETHPNILFKECSYFCEIVSSVEQIPRLLKIAMQTAIAKRGVAVLVISGDLALQDMRKQALPNWSKMTKSVVIPEQAVLEEIAHRLNAAKKVTLFCGYGAADAHQSLMALCAKLCAPIVHTLRGKAFIEYDNPYDVGMTGLVGFSSGYYAMEACDTLLLLGTNFPYRQFYPSKAEIIQIDLNGEQLGKRANITLGAVGDVNNTVQALLPLIQQKKDSSHLEQAVTHYKRARSSLDALACEGSDKKLIHPQYLARLINEEADEDTVFTSDVGTPTVWAARYLQMNGKRRLLGSFNHGSMANALAQAIGAQAAYPKRQTVALCGDGGFTMLMGDILTLNQQNLPIKVVVFNNGTLGFVEMEMHVGGMLEYSTELNNPNFAKMADAVGIKGFRVDESTHLREALQSAFAHAGPALVDVRVNRNELIMPPTINAAQVKGFSLYLMKAIINGQGTEVLDLMKTNLWR
ncbi:MULTISPECIES: ubiquinone-dependent pyruvate dehydrogenase [Legionella]|uniref:Pyruvate dehydrogenase [ubiquinone] n=1 Tax=Legionella maceachernii TaxID=466 RepID=A0A0W0VWC7_9GAMM|nr:ubiquinone-dependent pyruvate dehydrogenase [Legionella maceachernii]KTD24221.1 Pyruvate dehydrogenase [Legionella maceachernii]SJZ89463.1 pyruvate dehydrogenase (quinone) [Legionella maceachernii]SUO98763.1 Pyruvate dehydrogenase [ubiquinone] [Legionella maceachernii]